MKENFDDIIRRRWEERPYPVDPEHREEMTIVLDEQKRRKGFPFWWLSGLVLMLAIGVFGIMEMRDHKVEAKAKAEAEVTSPLGRSGQNAEAGENQEFMAKEQNAISENQELRDEENIAATKNSNLNSSLQNNTRVNQKDRRTRLNDRNRMNEANAPARRMDVNETKTKSPSERSGQKAKAEAKAKSGAEAQVEEKAMTNVDGEKINSREEEIKSAQESNLPPDGGYRVELENPGEVRIVSDIATIRVFPDSIEYDPWTNAIYHNGTVRSLNVTKPVASLKASEVNFTSDNHPGEIKSVKNNTHPIYLLAEAGAGMVLASKPLYDSGLKFNLGAGIGMRLQPKLHLQLTGGYQMQDGGFDFQRESTVNQPDFGVRSQFNTLEPDRLHFIYGKLGLAYRIKKYSLSAHVGTQYLYGAQGYITVVNHSQFSSEDGSTTKYAWLKTDGLRKWQWWSDVAAGYMILPKLYVQGGVGMYYSSLTEADPALEQEGYYWKGKTAKLQPFITLNYLLHGKL
jgi:hypothetical protein